VSYELLLRVLQQRTTYDKPYDERLYFVELTNALWERVRQARKVSEQKKGFFDLEL
jgi:hypothetical protein